jgi:hypothetical protein
VGALRAAPTLHRRRAGKRDYWFQGAIVPQAWRWPPAMPTGDGRPRLPRVLAINWPVVGEASTGT